MSHARGAAVLLLLTAAVGCTSEAAAPEPPASSPPASATAGVSPDPLPSDTVAPPRVDGRADAYGPARDSAVFSYDAAGAREDSIRFSFRCQGSGTLKVRVPVLHANFPVQCDRGDLPERGVDFAVPAARLAGTVHVTAPPGVTWAGSVGRGEAEEEDPSIWQRGPGEGS
ncbi:MULTISPECIES: hypothetical protein [Actinomycetes]|uniref:hypothetical protein n=1 Tax=Actinomycetes TaxID=1760 RepID=UPI00193FAB65|nr:hypothetical protein [Actinospica acidiphila]MBM4828752.1 hypothetical protein [Actinospica acidiphila]